MEATHESIDNLATTTVDGNVEISADSLRSILILLKFHPVKSISQSYIDLVQSLLSRKSPVVSNLEVAQGDAKPVKVPKFPDDQLAQVMDIIADYGRRCMEREQRRKIAKK
jgi:hypothetical protein